MSKTKSEIIRITVSVPAKHHGQLESLAAKNRVSVAWIVRDAIEKYLDTSSKAVAANEELK